MIATREIEAKLWNGAETLRGSMDAGRYKDYMLGLMFYKFLSDKTLDAYARASKNISLTQDELVEKYTEDYDNRGDSLVNFLKNILGGYYIQPQHLYQKWVKAINQRKFELQKVIDALDAFALSIATGDKKDGSENFKNLFSSLDLNDSALGGSLKDRSENISELIKLFKDLDMVNLAKTDVLGDAYEYLIGQFGLASGKKSGAFFTPHALSLLISRIVSDGRKIESVYDCACGSGGLLLTIRDCLSEDEAKQLKYAGIEKSTDTFNLCRMNLLLHGVEPGNIMIKNQDTMDEDWPEDENNPGEGALFDCVVENPPYSLKGWNRFNMKASDPRLALGGGVLPPNKVGDYAFLLHGLYHLKQNGIMGIVLPHGVLFRGGTEETIRRNLIQNDVIDGIIGLTNGMFKNTGISVIVMILRKDRQMREPITIIDASQCYERVGTINYLRESDIEKIFDAYKAKKEIPNFCHMASYEEIEANDFNLNIPRYVNAKEKEIPQDVDGHLYGGIPNKNITELKVLNEIVPNKLSESFKEIRNNYMQCIKDINELEDDIINDKNVKDIEIKVSDIINEYIDKWFAKLFNLAKEDNAQDLRNEMGNEIKKLLSEYDFVDEYTGYQVVVNLWNNHLSHDVEIAQEFGSMVLACQSRSQIFKTKKDEHIPIGWESVLLPSELIAKNIYPSEYENLEAIKVKLGEIEAQIAELGQEAADDSESILNDCLKEDKPELDKSKITAEMKNYSKGTEEYNTLNDALQLFKDKTAQSKAIKYAELELKNKVENKIDKLTEEECINLLKQKWFNNFNSDITNVVRTPIKKELATLKELVNRYSDKMSDIDEELERLEASFRELEKELVITNE